MAPLSAEFRHGATERAFLGEQLAQTQRQLRLALLFCAVFYLGFAVTDLAWIGAQQHTPALLTVRAAVVLCGLGCLWLLRRRPRSIKVSRLAASAASVAGSAGILLIAALRPSEFLLHAITMSILVTVLYIYIPNRLLYAVAVALGSTLGFIALAWWRAPLSAVELGTMATLLLLANVFGYVAALRYQRLWRDEYASRCVLRDQSIRDHLTGCYNRRHLHEQLLENELARAQRYKLSLTVIMCDLDHFKAINDNHGHHGGDAVLVMFAELLRSMTREGIDGVVRYGGEEFLLVLPETDLRGGVLLAERLRQALAATPIAHKQQLIRATASFGVASVDFASSANPAAHHGMIASADNLLYAAKKAGRNQVCALQLP
ncbi:GGDEF domain-containing protein [Rugamonas sp. CCM 8940]|nr:GGDEF domain-containing protein [Rugamonas sp. CCM 8940]